MRQLHYHLLYSTALILILDGCEVKEKQDHSVITETGLLVVDRVRNCTSFDYFIPCKINDTLSIIENMKRMELGVAMHMPQYKFDFDLMHNGWLMTKHELSPKDLTQYGGIWNVCAVEIKYKNDYRFSDEEHINYETEIRLGDLVIAKGFKSSLLGQTISLKQYLLPRK